MGGRRGGGGQREGPEQVLLSGAEPCPGQPCPVHLAARLQLSTPDALRGICCLVLVC